MQVKFGRIFAETIWASFKALLIMSLLYALAAGIIVSNMNLPSNNVTDSFMGIFVLSLIGALLLMPVLFVFDLLVMAPLIAYIIKKKYIDIKIFIIAGGICSSIFFNIFNLVSNYTFNFTKFIWDGVWFFIAGGLLGYFLYKQIFRISDVGTIEQSG
ncbi:MAG: hypothetical protein DI586_02015 [Micavibrio aeruginosavorus]|uniref:Uncharacterized protein n=1 Tax=Micavibrio aeruginosavorus TaxID=349221 RepID=A0A2W5HFL4_9BACT|nr:MAG: hypothetical protein DI586_02015 [Micavibrio aeruginosavorus]